jgi:Spy/CpxP family protein refolding chaperone
MNGSNRFHNRVLRNALVAAVVLPLIAVSAGFAQPQPGAGGSRGERRFGHGPGHGYGMGPFAGLRMLRDLNLTDEQRQQIRDQFQKARDTGALKQLMDARRALQDAVESPNLDEDNIRNLADQLGVAEGNAAVERAHLHQQILQILTDEQRQELEKMKAEAKQRMEERRERFEKRLQERSNGDADRL